MDFRVTKKRREPLSPKTAGKPEAVLVVDGWDDYGHKTLHNLVVFDLSGERHDIGKVKVAQVDFMGRVSLPSTFENLDETYFSLGQGENYYMNLISLGRDICGSVLVALRDVAADLEIFRAVRHEPALTTSLLRSIDSSFVLGRLHRLAHGDVALTPYSFRYDFPVSDSAGGDNVLLVVGEDEPPCVSMEFLVTPDSLPPTNIHVLIGRNGVGKTRCLNFMARSIVEQAPDTKKLGTFTFTPVGASSKVPGATFANVVTVTFSAFDSQGPLRATEDTRHDISYSYIGLWSKQRSSDQENGPRLRDFSLLAREFLESVSQCLGSSRRQSWLTALGNLDSDPLFKEANVSGLSDCAPQDLKKTAVDLFGRLSSGHAIVLLTITRLVESVNEQTLVLLDEPEGHLHPPLLAAFIRTLSRLLVERNGVAIIATHSPVVLQEVPMSCVWVLRRSGSVVQTHRTETETFGENVGTLTRSIFGLEVTDSGFHKLLRDATQVIGSNYESVVDQFDGKLGAEALAILRALIAGRNVGAGSEEP